MTTADIILAAMTARLADAKRAGLPCGVPSHDVYSIAEACGLDVQTAFAGLRELVERGAIEAVTVSYRVKA